MIRIWAGYAISAERFVVSAGDLNDETPRSVALSYNARHEMTWGYADLQRTIKSITALPDSGAGKHLFFALSNEGEVFHLTGEIPIEKIKGAGVWSDDAEGWGSTLYIAICDGRWYACGYGSQVYERIAEGDWQRLCDRNQPGVADSIFYGLTSSPRQGLVAVCGQKRVKYRTPSAEDQARINRARATGDEAAASAIEAQARVVEVPKSSCLYFRHGAEWREAETNFDGGLNACQAFPDGMVLAVGDHGVIVRAEGPDAVEDLSQPGLNDNLYTIGLWSNEVTILGDSGIHVFGPELEFRRTIALPDGLDLPNRHQALGNDLFYIDYGGLALYRDGAWQRIPIPDDMWTLAGG